jgi:hypothetical protein
MGIMARGPGVIHEDQHLVGSRSCSRMATMGELVDAAEVHGPRYRASRRSPERDGDHLKSLDTGVIVGIACVDGEAVGQRRGRNQRVVRSRGGFAA